ncbi:MAG TPA: TonB-dependent receptor [Bacteroidales bacterium]|nr:TonB-dependent receptor [Bacteroidales bacterium]
MTDLINEIKMTLRHGFPGLKVLLMYALFMISLPGFSQNITVKGTVTDSQTGEKMIGLNVVIKGTIRGVTTDLEGQYTMTDCPPNAVLVFSYVGYEQLEVPVQGRTTVDAAISSSSSVLDEIVVIGYGTVKKRDITGSVASVKGADLAAIPVSTAAEAMTGKMAGVQVITTEGSPDAEVRIRVRGGGSITQDNSPMFIVDGFPVSSISDIPASEIQSIDVLKDASSTAIYGARGANGVIIITTKGGIAGKVTVNYNAYYGFKKVANHLTSLGIEDYVKWQYEYALLSDNLENYEKFFGLYQDIDLYNDQPSINWFEQVFGHIGKTFNQDLTITGGSEKFRYSVGYSEMNSNEIMLSSRYRRDNVSLKLDHKPNDKIELSFSMRYSNTDIGGSGGTDQSNATPNDARVKQTMIFGPTPFTAMGEYDDQEVSSSMVNPLNAVVDNDRQQLRTRYTMGGSFAWNIIENLQLKTEIGLQSYLTNDDRFYGLTTYYVRNTPSVEFQNDPALISTKRKNVQLRNTNTLTYDLKNLLGTSGHSVKVLLGHEVIQVKSNEAEDIIWGFPDFFTSEEAINLTDQGRSYLYSNTISPDNKLLSFFGRANYDYKGRYLISATFRADGSSKFGKGNRWGYFPSAAIAWRISEEDFMKSLSSVINNLKVRFSYGAAGNNNIPANMIAQVFASSTTSYINNVLNYWSPEITMANPDLKWETTYTRNFGLDFGLFKGTLYGAFELYYNTTKDLLIEFPVSGTGYQTQYRNMGETENKGLEVTLNWIALNKKDFGLTFGFNIGFNKNKIVSLDIMEDFGMNTSWASTEIGDDYWIATGGSVGQMKGYQNEGRYEVSDFVGYDAANDTWILKENVDDSSPVVGKLRPGSLKLVDNTGDGLINVDDCVIIGDANPIHTGGFNIDARFYGFDLSAVFNWSYGNDIYNANKIEYTTGRYQFRNMVDIMAEGQRWTNLDADGNLVTDAATLQAMNATTTMWSPYMTRHVFSDWAVEDGSFLRLNTLSLGYTIPSVILSKIHIQNLRFYVSGYNVFLLTNYSGFDPEVSSRRNTGLTPGVDYSAYPKSRQLLFGLNLSF